MTINPILVVSANFLFHTQGSCYLAEVAGDHHGGNRCYFVDLNRGYWFGRLFTWGSIHIHQCDELWSLPGIGKTPHVEVCSIDSHYVCL